MGWSTWRQSAVWPALRLPWASQAPAPPLVPWKTCTKRTPLSTSRRAARHCWPNVFVTSWSRPYSLAGRFGLGVELQHLGHGRLHAEGELVALDAGAQAGSSGYWTAASRLSLPTSSNSASCSSW